MKIPLKFEIQFSSQFHCKTYIIRKKTFNVSYPTPLIELNSFSHIFPWYRNIFPYNRCKYFPLNWQYFIYSWQCDFLIFPFPHFRCFLFCLRIKKQSIILLLRDCWKVFGYSIMLYFLQVSINFPQCYCSCKLKKIHFSVYALITRSL